MPSPPRRSASSPPRRPLDLLLALLGVGYLAFVPTAFTVEFVVLGVLPSLGVAVPDLPSWFAFAATALVSLPLAGWYWWTGRSLGDLGMWFFWTVALGVPTGAALVVTLGVSTASVETGSLAEYLVRMAFVAVVYAVAYRLARRGGTRSGSASDDELSESSANDG